MGGHLSSHPEFREFKEFKAGALELIHRARSFHGAPSHASINQCERQCTQEREADM